METEREQRSVEELLARLSAQQTWTNVLTLLLLIVVALVAFGLLAVEITLADGDNIL